MGAEHRKKANKRRNGRNAYEKNRRFFGKGAKRLTKYRGDGVTLYDKASNPTLKDVWPKSH